MRIVDEHISFDVSIILMRCIWNVRLAVTSTKTIVAVSIFPLSSKARPLRPNVVRDSNPSALKLRTNANTEFDPNIKSRWTRPQTHALIITSKHQRLDEHMVPTGHVCCVRRKNIAIAPRTTKRMAARCSQMQQDDGKVTTLFVFAFDRSPISQLSFVGAWCLPCSEFGSLPQRDVAVILRKRYETSGTRLQPGTTKRWTNWVLRCQPPEIVAWITTCAAGVRSPSHTPKRGGCQEKHSVAKTLLQLQWDI